MLVEWINSLLVFLMCLFSFEIHLLSDCSLTNNPNNHNYFFKTFKSYQFSERGECINNALPWYRFYDQRMKDKIDGFAADHICKMSACINFGPRGSVHFAVQNNKNSQWSFACTGDGSFQLKKLTKWFFYKVNVTARMHQRYETSVTALPLFLFNEIFRKLR